MGDRLRGSSGVKQRRRRLADNPVCVHCEEQGIVKATEELDHILPLSQGGLDEDDNIQGLCKFHHKIKSAAEDSSREAVSTHPDWLSPSAIPVVLVCGPPSSGKTTYVKKHADKIRDTIIDMDAIAREIDPDFDGQWERDLLNQAMRQRNAILGSLQNAKNGKAWLIVGAPTSRERMWWAMKLGISQGANGGAGSEIVHLDVSAEECIARGADPRKIETYFRAARSMWMPPKQRRKKVGIDADGYPIE